MSLLAFLKTALKWAPSYFCQKVSMTLSPSSCSLNHLPVGNLIFCSKSTLGVLGHKLYCIMGYSQTIHGPWSVHCTLHYTFNRALLTKFSTKYYTLNFKKKNTLQDLGGLL